MVRNRNMLDHDEAPQYRGPTLSTTNTVTAPQTQSKTSYVCLALYAKATNADGNKHQRAETPRSSSLHVSPSISQTLRKKRGWKGRGLPVRREEGVVARPRRKVDEDEVRRDGPDVMVCSCDSDAHACRDERASPYCQYWRCEGKEASQEE